MATGIFVFLFTVCWHVLVFNGASRVTGVLLQHDFPVTIFFIS